MNNLELDKNVPFLKSVDPGWLFGASPALAYAAETQQIVRTQARGKHAFDRTAPLKRTILRLFHKPFMQNKLASMAGRFHAPIHCARFVFRTLTKPKTRQMAALKNHARSKFNVTCRIPIIGKIGIRM